MIASQLATASALRERLDEHSGAILGDDVGAGKTYVTFALLAGVGQRSAEGRWDLRTKPTTQDEAVRPATLQDYLRFAMPDRTLA